MFHQKGASLLPDRHVADIGIGCQSPIFGSADDRNANTARGVYGSYDRRTALNAKLAYRWNRNLTMALSADNPLNRQYFDFVKQPGTTALAELVVKF